jgi:hypothetical protein
LKGLPPGSPFHFPQMQILLTLSVLHNFAGTILKVEQVNRKQEKNGC